MHVLRGLLQDQRSPSGSRGMRPLPHRAATSAGRVDGRERIAFAVDEPCLGMKAEPRCQQRRSAVAASHDESEAHAKISVDPAHSQSRCSSREGPDAITDGDEGADVMVWPMNVDHEGERPWKNFLGRYVVGAWRAGRDGGNFFSRNAALELQPALVAVYFADSSSVQYVTSATGFTGITSSTVAISYISVQVYPAPAGVNYAAVDNLYFGVPSPGALALLSVAGLVGGRRRR